MNNYIQILNPLLNRYVKIDQDTGRIIQTKKTSGPYKNIPVRERTYLQELQELSNQQHLAAIYLTETQWRKLCEDHANLLPNKTPYYAYRPASIGNVPIVTQHSLTFY